MTVSRPLPANLPQLRELAARLLVGTAFAAAVLLIGSAIVDLAIDRPSRFTPLRVGYGLLLSAAALVSRRLGRNHPVAASTVVLVAGMSIGWLNAVLAGIGLHALALTAGLLMIALSGVLCSRRATLGFALANAAALAAIYLAEMSGRLTGPQAAAALSSTERLIGQLLLTAIALMAALLLARLLRDSLGRAIAQEQRLDGLLRIGSDWTWELDAKGLVTYLSPSFEARTGRSVAEYLQSGRPGGPMPVDDDDWRQLQQAMRERRSFRDQVASYRSTDGSLLVCSASADPVFDADGRFTGWRGLSRNVTAEHRAQQLQRRTSLLLDRLVATTPDAICVVRLADGVIVWANPRFRQFAGLADAEVVGRRADEVGLWAEAGVPAALRERLERDGELRDLRTTAHLGGSAPRPVLLSAATFEWDGEPVAVIGTRDTADVDRARAEADAILDHASVGIALVRGRRFERVNPPFEAMFGRARGSLAGLPIATLFDDDGAAFADFAFGSELGLRQARPVEIEREARRADGSTLLVRFSAAPIAPGQLPDTGAIWVAEDITERRRAERELAAAKQHAEAANLAKSAFLANMSHEIRTPLNGVLGLARLMQDPSLDERRRREYLDHLVGAAEQLGALVSDVLDLSKIEAGHLQIETIVFDLHALAQGSFATFAPLGRERGLAMRCRIELESPSRVRGDPVRVRQILANYLSNALKFTVEGEITLQVCRTDSGRVRLAVSDTGPGLSAEVRAQLFRPFAQGDTSTTRRFGGTGLGLSICRELAERMGGRVGADSDGSHGSCFWAELDLPAEPHGAAPAQALPAEGLPLEGLRVLVAEDNAVNMLIVGAMLQRLGAQVIEADNGLSAVEHIQAEPGAIDAVLMDLHMPEVDGLEAARRIRELPSGARLPIFALSAAVLEQERQAAQAAGMNGFIAKPASEAELLRALGPLVRRAAAD